MILFTYIWTTSVSGLTSFVIQDQIPDSDTITHDPHNLFPYITPTLLIPNSNFFNFQEMYNNANHSFTSFIYGMGYITENMKVLGTGK